MDIRLKSINLENFKKHRNQQFDFDGQNCTINGSNAEGKTTIKNAFLWVLTGKDEDGRKDYQIRNTSLSIECEPTATIVIDIDGVETVLTRELRSTFKGKGLEKRYDGDTTKCFIDTLPRSLTDYNKYIEDLFPLSPAIWIDLYHFNSDKVKNSDRRNYMTNIFGTITDEDTMKKIPSLEPIFKEKGKHSIEDYKAIKNERYKALIKELGSANSGGTLSARIDEANKAMTDNVDVDVEVEKTKIEIANKEIERLNAEKVKLQENKKLDEVKLALGQQNLLLDRLKAENKDFRSEKEKDLLGKLSVELAGIKTVLEGFITEKNEIRKSIGIKELSIKHLFYDITALENKKLEISEKEWNGDTTCPTCNQTIPEKRIAETKGNFNEQKAISIETADKNIIEHKKIIKQLEVDVEKLNDNLKIIVSDIAKYEIQKSNIEQKIDSVNKKVTDRPNFKKQCTALEKEISKIEKEKLELESETVDPSKVEKIRFQINEQNLIISGCHSNIAKQEKNETQKARIKSLEETKILYSSELGVVEKAIAACDDFIKARADLMEEGINKWFDGVIFRLFDRYDNGSLKDNCILMMDGKEYGSLSAAEKIRANIATLNGFSKKFNFTAPLFIDSATELDGRAETKKKINTKAQRILIKVALDSKIEIEKE